MSFLDTKDAGPMVIEVPPADATAKANWLPAPDGPFALIVRA